MDFRGWLDYWFIFFKLNKPVDTYYPIDYIAIHEYKEMLNEIFPQSHEGPVRSESGKDH